MTIVSGIQPSGKLHVGNYLGAVKNWLALQADTTNHCFFFIADWHSLTEEYDPRGKAAQVRELVAELLACGIDPKRVTLFRQSDLPEHLELAWYFSCVTPVGEMERMTQYKDKIGRGESPNVGLFTYPILMAADILAYANTPSNSPSGRRGEKNDIGVPVGDDQKQHLELANDIVRRCNRRYGPTFPEVQYLPAPTARVMSLKDPMRKMSKSLGGDHCLFLDDSPKEVERKLRSAVTDTGGQRSKVNGQTSRMMSPGVRTLFEVLEAFGSKAEMVQLQKAHDVGTIKYSELKPAVARAFIEHFKDFRDRKAEILADPKRIDVVLTQGVAAARAVAQQTLEFVRMRMGIR